MMNISGRTPIHKSVYNDLETEDIKRKVMTLIDKSVKSLKKKEFLSETISKSLKASVDKHIQEEKLKIQIEYSAKVDELERLTRYRLADREEIQHQLEIIEKEITDLQQDYDLLEKLYKDNNISKLN